MFLLRLFILFVLLISFISSLPSYHHRVPQEHPADDYYNEGYSDYSASFPFLRHRRAGRLCGTQLTKTISKVCGGCIKSNHDESEAVSKRSEFWSVPLKREDRPSLVRDCCQNKCTLDYLKKFCC